MYRKLLPVFLVLFLSMLLCGFREEDYHDAVFHPELSEGDDSVRLDLSAVSEGYVAVSAVSESRLKFQVIKEQETYTYNIASDGTPSVFPLSLGDGEYRFRVMENVREKKYAERYSADCTVVMRDEFQPFLRPSDYVRYTRDSICVRKAAELSEAADGEIAFITAVYDEICNSIVYDSAKAATVRSGYLPDPDETILSGKGICFDYASLAAAMLRSQGIPTKEIFGYVSPDGLYHAWNMFYTKETGWITVSFETGKASWNRLDLTFSANGAAPDFVGDGSNYEEMYYY